MRVLLDTHSFLWFIGGDRHLAPAAREVIEDIDNDVLVSVASLWEIAIKSSLGRLILGSPFDTLNQIEILPIDIDDLSMVTKLPFHHRDPFDRLIIAQALTKGLPIVGKDAAFVKCPVELIRQRRVSRDPVS